MDAGRVAFDGDPGGFLSWAQEADPALETPAARMFSLAGIEPLPVGVREARHRLAEIDRGGMGDPSLSVEAEARSPADSVLELKNLWVELGDGDARRDVLKGVDLTVERGERVALMGRNGAGKSTLLRTVAGLEKPARGKVAAAEGVALLTQNPGDFLVRERVGDELPGEEGLEALRVVGLEDATDADPRDLSGGERQRLALAIVLAGRMDRGTLPGLVALDEPTRGMDRARKGDLADLISRLARAGAGVVVATHDVEFAVGFADRVVLLGDGVAIADADCGDVLSGGWYFATEVARILDLPGVVTPEQGAAHLGGGSSR